MKNIVVPTDFSDHAANALDYAINIANHFGSKIHLIHAFGVKTRTGMLVTPREFIRKDAEKDLALIVENNIGKLSTDTRLEALAIEGYTGQVITRYAKSIDADMIIMGTQGASGLREIFIGSFTVSVIRNTDIPILAIPSDYSYQIVNEITLAIDSYKVSSANVVKPLVMLAKTYQAPIFILHVTKEKVLVGVDDGIDNYLSDVEHSFHLVNDEKIKAGIDDFVEKTETDLLCMIHRGRGVLRNLFHKSVVSKEAFDSPVPLLVLSDDK